jgi:CelD/BcsL family acetyltransferase involved in cellulose biosynthesis
MTVVNGYAAGVYDGPAEDWDAYVLRHPQGRFCHLTQYQRAVDASYGLRAVPFALRRGSQLCGILSISAGRSLLFGRKWISMPYGEYGGFLFDADVEPSQARRLVTAVIDQARKHAVRSIEINGLLGLPEGVEEYFAPSAGYESAVLDLSPGPAALLEKVFTYEVRKALRKAESRSLTAHEASDPDTLARVFYPLHLNSMHRLGVPPHAPQYFTALKAAFGEDMKIFWAEREGKRLAGLLGIRSGDRVQIFATVSTPDGWEDRPNDLAHWAFIRWACEAGVRWFDFGSVRYEGQRRFKKKWGVAFAPAAHWVAGLGAGTRAVTFDSTSESLSRASRIWKATIPIPVTRWLGPVLRKQLLR